MVVAWLPTTTTSIIPQKLIDKPATLPMLENTGQKSLLSVQAATSCTVTNNPPPAPFQPKGNKLASTRPTLSHVNLFTR